MPSFMSLTAALRAKGALPESRAAGFSPLVPGLGQAFRSEKPLQLFAVPKGLGHLAPESGLDARGKAALGERVSLGRQLAYGLHARTRRDQIFHQGKLAGLLGVQHPGR